MAAAGAIRDTGADGRRPGARACAFDLGRGDSGHSKAVKLFNPAGVRDLTPASTDHGGRPGALLPGRKSA